MANPQLTMIAGYVADLLPDEGVEPEVTKQEWRDALRIAREDGDAEWLMDYLERQDTGDGTMRTYCDELRR